MREDVAHELERRVMQDFRDRVSTYGRTPYDPGAFNRLWFYPLMQCNFTGVHPQDGIRAQLLAAVDRLAACTTIAQLLEQLRQLRSEIGIVEKGRREPRIDK